MGCSYVGNNRKYYPDGRHWVWEGRVERRHLFRARCFAHEVYFADSLRARDMPVRHDVFDDHCTLSKLLRLP